MRINFIDSNVFIAVQAQELLVGPTWLFYLFSHLIFSLVRVGSLLNISIKCCLLRPWNLVYDRFLYLLVGHPINLLVLHLNIMSPKPFK
jgi:hypothetical protein